MVRCFWNVTDFEKQHFLLLQLGRTEDNCASRCCWKTSRSRDWAGRLPVTECFNPPYRTLWCKKQQEYDHWHMRRTLCFHTLVDCLMSHMAWLADKSPIVAPLRLNHTLLKRRTTSCAMTAGFTAACPPQAQCRYLEWAVIKKLIKAFAHERSALSRHLTNLDGATLCSRSSGTIYSRVISASAISRRSRSFSTQQVRVATLAP